MSLDEMLSRKFGKEVTNYFAGLPLNRVGFLRSDHAFLNMAVKHPSTSYLLFNNLGPLTKDPSKLAFLSYKDVKPLIGNDPFRDSEEQLLAEYNSTTTRPLLMLLGLDEKRKDGLTYKRYSGAPYFALDVTPKGSIREQAESLILAAESKGLQFFEGRSHMKFSPEEGNANDSHIGRKAISATEESAIFAMARSINDWNTRNPYCAQCGQTTLSVHAGVKRACPPTDLAAKDVSQNSPSGVGKAAAERLPCTTRTTISNISFCRTDASIIVAVISSDGKRALLGHNSRWQPYWYSTLAGFLEPGESAEEATRREVWEETGVKVGRVVVHSTQPWPYPSSLMIGAVAQALPGQEEISLSHDAELEDARWFDLQEVAEALDTWTSPMGEPAPPGYIEGKLRLPPSTAVANQLLRAIVGGFTE